MAEVAVEFASSFAVLAIRILPLPPVAATSGAWLLLLHGDARLPRDWPVLVSRAIGHGLRRAWVFRLAIAGGRLDLGLVAWLANAYLRVAGITGRY